MRYLNVTALTLASVMTIGCSSDDENNDHSPATEKPATEVQQTVTLTTTICLGGESASRTRALSAEGVKTFAVGDQIAVVYTNTNSERVKAVSNALVAGDITNDGKNATITVTLTNPVAGSVGYVYPAAMTKDDGSLNYSALCIQDGTPSSLANSLDCAKGTGTMTNSGSGFALPANVELDNQFAICEFKIKNSVGTEITSSITGLTLSDGTNVYTVNRAAAAGPIYVAMQPVTSDKTLSFVANDASQSYYKTVTGKALAANDMVPVNLTMNLGTTKDLSTLDADYTAETGDMLTGKLAASHKISIAAGDIVTLKNADVNYDKELASSEYAGITCLGNATLIVSGTDYVKGFSAGYPGIFVPSGSTLTITGNGTLYAQGDEYGAGIGSGRSDIEAVKNCGNIIIQGGTIWGTGGTGAAGIGSGAGGYEDPSSCGNITIKSSVTQVYATAGSGADPIGRGDHATCGIVTLENTDKITQY